MVNVDLGMRMGKLAAQVGHACQLCTEYEVDTYKYNEWRYHNDYKKIILRGHQKDLERLEKEGKFYAVRDCGYTELPPNSLTAVSLGILSREEAKPYVKRMQLL